MLFSHLFSLWGGTIIHSSVSHSHLHIMENTEYMLIDHKDIDRALFNMARVQTAQ